jgi:hypothetical protein
MRNFAFLPTEWLVRQGKAVDGAGEAPRLVLGPCGKNCPLFILQGEL